MLNNDDVATDEELKHFVALLYRGLLRRMPDESGLNYFTNQLRTRNVSSVIEEFIQCEEFKTISRDSALYVAPGHYFSPIVNIEEAKIYFDELLSRAVPSELPGISIDKKKMVDLWHSLLEFLQKATFPPTKNEAFRYYSENNSYNYGDASILSAMIQRYKPNTIIEVGCGFSSACILDTIDNFIETECHVTFIEPYPQLLYSLVSKGDERVTIIPKKIQEVPLETFQKLSSGDILFIDSTHILRTGSDVCFELFEILPVLAPGVIVHFHDIFWPFEYPRQWVLEDNRSWNELYAIRAFLINNRKFEIVFFNDYFAKLENKLISETFPRFLINPGGALWLKCV